MIRTTAGGKHRAGSRRSANDGGSPSAGRRGFFRRFWWVFVAVPLAVVLGAIGTIWYAYARTSIPQAPPGAQTTYVYDLHGNLVATLHTAVNRTVVPLSRISPNLQHAVIAIEDRNFYHEGGVNFTAIVRAAWADVTHGRLEQGGSTITQQYVKNVYTGNERTFARKIKEAILAVKVDHKYTKNEILEKYLNLVYFGNGAYGAQAAAETYWGIPASKLNPLQAATLAGLIRAPASFDPIGHPDEAKVRRNLVLAQMAQQGYLSQAEADQLRAEPVTVKKNARKKFETTRYPYFVSWLSRLLGQRYSYQEVFSGGLRVTTTLDVKLQRAAEAAVRRHLSHSGDPTAALVAIDPRTGEIRALVGGTDWSKSQYNNATQAHRQAGSSFKTFTLATAMEERISPNSVWSGPSQITIPDPQCRTNGQDWQPRNYADESGGTMTLLQATAHSVNTIFAQLVVAVGPQNVADVAHKMGITSPLQPVCSITLGTQGVTPLEMTDGYATLAARGVHHAPQWIRRVSDSQGKVLDELHPAGDRALQQNDADLVTYALQGVITGGTGTAARLADRPAAGKTGTAQDYKDAWFCGFVPQLTTCVWVGYPTPKPMNDVEGFSTVFGGSIPAGIWHDFMTEATQGLPVEGFATPSFSGYNANPKGATSPTPSPSPSPSPSTTPSPSPTETTPPTTPPTTTPPTTTPPTTTPPSPTPTSSGGAPSPSGQGPSP